MKTLYAAMQHSSALRPCALLTSSSGSEVPAAANIVVTPGSERGV